MSRRRSARSVLCGAQPPKNPAAIIQQEGPPCSFLRGHAGDCSWLMAAKQRIVETVKAEENDAE